MRTIVRRTIAAIIVASAFCSQAQTNIFIQSPVIAADQTAKISWNSQVGAVYQVWSADALAGVGPQGLQWIIRNGNCASKGTNAEWMDVGDPLWIPRILPPRLQPERFYRVEQVGHATLTPPIVTVQLSQTNGAISGDLYATVNVTLVDTNEQLSGVNLIVDGQKFFTAGDYSFTAFINSCEWPNGPHEIYAVATTVDTGETLPTSEAEIATNAANIGIGVSASQFGIFSNYISQYFVAVPFFDPTAGQTQEVVALFPENTCWRLTVLDYQDNPVRQFTNQSPSLYVAFWILRLLHRSPSSAIWLPERRRDEFSHDRIFVELRKQKRRSVSSDCKSRSVQSCRHAVPSRCKRRFRTHKYSKLESHSSARRAGTTSQARHHLQSWCGWKNQRVH
jgi:hypothetical protein